MMNDLLKNDKPDIRELTLERGLSYPSDEELLMLILGSGTKDVPIKNLARKVCQVVDETEPALVLTELEKIKGMGSRKALAVAAALEFGRRKCAPLGALIISPSDLIPYVQGYAMKTQEHFLCATLNGAHEIIQIHVISVGTLNKTIIHPREVFSMAIRENAAAIILCHNHPSGKIMPSDEDIETTVNLLQAADVLDIPILDHIIIDRNSYFSFVEHQLLFTK